MNAFEDAALDAFRRGYTPLRIKPGKKAPDHGNDWQAVAYADPEAVRTAFQAASGVGLLLGRGLADVDLDCQTAIDVAHLFLPYTAMRSGRPGAPDSHWWYEADEEGYVKHALAKDATLVELRADRGHQTVIPPTPHPSGETVAWTAQPFGGDNGPTKARTADLRVAVAGIAIVSALADHWPTGEGTRNEACLCLSGWLLREGGHEEPALVDLAERVVRALAEVTGDDEAHVRVKETVRPTVDKYESGEAKVRGWTALREAIGDLPDNVFKACQAALRDAQAAAGLTDFSAQGQGQPPKSDKPLAVQLRERVEADFDVFPGDDDGRVFVQAKAGGRAELLTGGFVIRAGRGAGMQMSTLSAAATEASKVLAALAEVEPARPIHTRVCQEPGRIVLDLAQPGNSRCVVVTAAGWRVEAVPPPGVVFRLGSGKPLPDPERGGSVEELREILRWAADDPRWLLVKGWLPCSLLASVPRPMLGLFGPQGSAKSTTGRFVTGVVDPKAKGVLGSGFGKKQSDDETKALGNYLVAWDNVSAVSGDGADFLSRLVTGDSIERRKLYSDTDLVQIVYRRTGVVTGISLPRGVKPDTLDRLVLIVLGALTERLSEAEMEAAWEAAHPRVLAGVLDLAVRLLAGRGANPDRLRMADYAEALWAIDPALYRAYADNVRQARLDMAADDPFLAAILAWLAEEPGQRWEGTAADARDQAGCHNLGEWWPRNGKAFMDVVTASLELLREVGVTVEERRSNGQRLKRFALSPLSAADRELL